MSAGRAVLVMRVRLLDLCSDSSPGGVGNSGCGYCCRSPLFRRLMLKGSAMCRNIRILFNFEPPVTEGEIQAAALQYVRKVSGFNKPSAANEAAFQTAVEEIAAASERLLRSLRTNAPSRNREDEAAKARARNAERFAK
jgi:hypothetical protein